MTQEIVSSEAQMRALENACKEALPTLEWKTKWKTSSNSVTLHAFIPETHFQLNIQIHTFYKFLSARELKLGDRVRAQSFEHLDKQEGTVEAIAMGLVVDNTVYVHDAEILALYEANPDEMEFREIGSELEPVVKLRLKDGSSFWWFNAFYELLSRGDRP